MGYICVFFVENMSFVPQLSVDYRCQPEVWRLHHLKINIDSHSLPELHKSHSRYPKIGSDNNGNRILFKKLQLQASMRIRLAHSPHKGVFESCFTP